MTYDPRYHHRRSIRLPTYDYSSSGAYFLTICTFQRRLLFGEVIGEEVRLSGSGRIVAEEWKRSEGIRKEIQLDEFIVMPNHVHAIVWIAKAAPESEHGATAGSPYEPRRFAGQGPGRRTISSLVGGFKSAATRRINESRRSPYSPIWQRDFYERVIRDEAEFNRARQYILDNPRKWAEDKHNPANSDRAA